MGGGRHVGEKCVTKIVPSIVNTNSLEGLKPQDPFSDEKMSPGPDESLRPSGSCCYKWCKFIHQ